MTNDKRDGFEKRLVVIPRGGMKEDKTIVTQNGRHDPQGPHEEGQDETKRGTVHSDTLYEVQMYE